METSAKTATNVNDIFYEIGMTFYCVVLEFISQITQRLKLKYESTLLSWSFGVCTCIEELFFWVSASGSQWCWLVNNNRCFLDDKTLKYAKSCHVFKSFRTYISFMSRHLIYFSLGYSKEIASSAASTKSIRNGSYGQTWGKDSECIMLLLDTWVVMSTVCLYLLNGSSSFTRNFLSLILPSLLSCIIC